VSDPLTVPTVHLNGTSRHDLAAGYETAYVAVGEALDAVQEVCPNARDYYVQDNTAFSKAAADHASRIQRIKTVQAELLVLFEAVDR
jgi:uncharacterized NAD-dependent epimerase/dehydratase family protein